MADRYLYVIRLGKSDEDNLNPVPASEAEEREEALALRLRRKGWAVWWH